MLKFPLSCATQALLCLCCFISEAGAVMQGEFRADAPVVQLLFEHKDWHEYKQEWLVSHSECSAVIVGHKPLTLLTAAHCLRDVAKQAENGLPTVSIAQAAQPTLLQAKLQHAVFPEFDKVRGNLIDDLAVLVFDLQLPEDQPLAPVLLDSPSGQVMVCGFGYGAADALPQTLRCGTRAMQAATAEFPRFLPTEYESLDPLFYARYRTQFEGKTAAVSSLEALWALNRLNDSGQYDVRLPMPTLGDSGGPWLEVLDMDVLGKQRYAVVGVTSFVESFYGSSPQWAFFKQSSAPLHDFVYAAYGIRLDSIRARKLFNAARIKGADIRVIRQNWLEQ